MPQIIWARLQLQLENGDATRDGENQEKDKYHFNINEKRTMKTRLTMKQAVERIDRVKRKNTNN
jgi:hypothetical protein